MNTTAAVAAGIAVPCYPSVRKLSIRSARRRRTVTRADSSSKQNPSEGPAIDTGTRKRHCAGVSGAAPAEQTSRKTADVSGEGTVGADLVCRCKRIRIQTQLAMENIISRTVPRGNFR